MGDEDQDQTASQAAELLLAGPMGAEILALARGGDSLIGATTDRVINGPPEADQSATAAPAQPQATEHGQAIEARAATGRHPVDADHAKYGKIEQGGPGTDPDGNPDASWRSARGGEAQRNLGSEYATHTAHGTQPAADVTHGPTFYSKAVDPRFAADQAQQPAAAGSSAAAAGGSGPTTPSFEPSVQPSATSHSLAGSGAAGGSGIVFEPTVQGQQGGSAGGANLTFEPTIGSAHGAALSGSPEAGVTGATATQHGSGQDASQAPHAQATPEQHKVEQDSSMKADASTHASSHPVPDGSDGSLYDHN